MNKIYKSILLKLSAVSPLFAKVILDNALAKIHKDSTNVTASEMLYLLKREINPQLSRPGSVNNTILSSAAGFLITNADDQIIYLNDFSRKILSEVKKKFPAEKDFESLYHAGLVRRTADTQKLHVFDVELAFLSSTFNVSVAPIFNDAGSITGTLSIFQDVTVINELEKESMEHSIAMQAEIRHRIEMEKKLIDQQQSMIRSSNLAALGEMGAGIAHEINNPLSVILMSNKLLTDHFTGKHLEQSVLDHCLELSNNAINKINAIINSMMILARNLDDVPFAPSTMQEILDQTLPLCRAKFSYYAIDFIIDDKSELLNFPIQCRAGEIGQVLINLLNNSYDAVQNLPHKWVRIKLDRTDHHMVISVIDSGNGIPTHIADRIFDPFYSTKGIGKGTGLGVSISLKIMQNHGGDLQLDPNYPHTKFDLLLPLNPQA